MAANAAIGGTGQLLSSIIEVCKAVVKGLKHCLTAKGSKTINEIETSELHDNYSRLSKRIQNIEEDYHKDPDGYETDVAGKIEKIKKSIESHQILFSSQKSKVLHNLFATGVIEKKFKMLRELHSDLCDKAQNIEDILKARGTFAVHPDHPSPTVIDGKTITVGSVKTEPKLTITFNDENNQIMHIKEYVLQIRDHSDRTSCKYLHVQSPTFKVSDDTVSVHAGNLHASTYYAVRICKLFTDGQHSLWSVPSRTVCTTSLYPVVPEATDTPFTSPGQQQLTISLRRPEGYPAMKVKQCRVDANPTECCITTEEPEPYVKTLDIAFNEKEEVHVLSCPGFKMADKECSFGLCYIDYRNISSQAVLSLTEKIGSLTPSRIHREDLKLEPKHSSCLEVTWTPPKNNNAGAVKHYIVECHNKVNSKYRECKQRSKEVEVGVASLSVILDGLVREKKYMIIVYAENYSGDKSQPCTKTYTY